MVVGQKPITRHARRWPLRRMRYHCSEEILEVGIVQHRIRQKTLQTGILLLEAVQPLGLADVHPAILGFPLLNGRNADALLAAPIGHGNPGHMLFQDADDLGFGEPATFQLWSSWLGQGPFQTGLAGGGNVKGPFRPIRPFAKGGHC